MPLEEKRKLVRPSYTEPLITNIMLYLRKVNGELEFSTELSGNLIKYIKSLMYVPTVEIYAQEGEEPDFGFNSDREGIDGILNGIDGNEGF